MRSFEVGTIEWEQRKRLLSSDKLIYMVLRRFYVAHFYLLYGEIVERCFSLKNINNVLKNYFSI